MGDGTAQSPVGASQTAWRQEWHWLLLAVVAAWIPFAHFVFLGRVPLAHDVGLSDLLHAHEAYDVALGEAVRQGRLPLWFDGPYLGSNFVGQIEAAVLYPPRWIALGLLPQWTAFGAILGFHVAVAASGAWFLARRLGISPASAALVGMAFGASGFFAAHLKHPNMIASAAYLPWVLLAVMEVRRRPWPWWVVGPVVVAASWLGGHPQIAYYVTLAAIVVACWVHRRSARGLVLSAGLVSLGGLLAAVQVLPTLLFAARTARGAPDWAYASRFAMEWFDLVWLIEPTLRGDPYSGSYFVSPGGLSLPWEVHGHVGWLTLPLIVVALLAQGPQRRLAWRLALVIVGLVLFALGPATPIYGWLWSLVPGMTAFRFPSRVLVLIGLGLAILMGIGLDALVRERGWSARWVGLVALATSSLQLSVAHRPFLVSDAAAHWTAPSPWLEAASEAAAAPQRFYVVSPMTPWRQTFMEHAGWRDGLGPYRALAGLPLGNRGRAFGVASPDGYSAMMHERPSWYWMVTNRHLLQGAPPLVGVDDEGGLPPWALRRLQKASVTHLVIPRGLPWKGGVLFEKGGHRLVEVPHPRPVAFVVDGWRGATDAGEARRLADELDDVVVEGVETQRPWEAGPIQVPFTSPRPEEVRVDVRGLEGLLVLAHSWDEGWRAWVDGEEVDILVADGYLRAVLLPRGAEQVVFQYWPPGLTVGLLGSGVGGLLLTLVAGLVWRRRDAWE